MENTSKGVEAVKEQIVNLFLYIDTKMLEDGTGVIRQIGATWHEREGTDAEKLAFLQSQVAADFPKARRYPLPTWCVLVPANDRAKKGLLSYPAFQKLVGIGKHMEIFEDAVFKHCPQAPREPLMVLTCIVDGKVKIEASTDMLGNLLE